MRVLTRRLFQELDRDDIDWDRESVAFEFVAVACLLHAATANGWNASCAVLPPRIRFDSWCRFPAHSFGRFGRGTRRSTVEELAGALSPRFSLRGPSGQIVSIYYQGFPPKDVPYERPDWIILPAETSVRLDIDRVTLRVHGAKEIWEGIYETVLGPYGPSRRHESGILCLPCGIIEVGLSKDSAHINRQISRYKRIYGPVRCVGFLAGKIRRMNNIEFPVVAVPRKWNESAFTNFVEAGEEIFKVLMS